MLINLRIRTAYSFGVAYGPLPKVIAAVRDAPAIGISDRSGSWGHVAFEKAMRKAGKRPLFGAELGVVPDLRRERHPPNYMAFIARNNAGLRELYELITEATSGVEHDVFDPADQSSATYTNFYYRPRIDYARVTGVSDNIIILSGTNPAWGKLHKQQKNLFVELAPSSQQAAVDWSKAFNRPLVATSDNYYPTMDDKRIYEIIAGTDLRRSKATGEVTRFMKADTRTTAMHIVDEYEWANYWPNRQSAVALTERLAAECTAEIPKAKMVKFHSDKTLEQLCVEAAPGRRIDLNDKVYAARLRRELDMIADKDFADYFFVIWDMLKYAKQHMLVGPARGSSCGSLVCYLLSITEIDPIPFDLIFERFIDVNRKDLPDIDIDFPDDRRDMVFEYIRQKYGMDCVARLGTIMSYQAKSSIDAVAISLQIPKGETEALKGAIIERSTGDARAAFCILDTFNELEIGKMMLAKYPHLKIAADIEAHPKGSGQHAAGIVITQEPISRFCSMNQQTGAVMVDKYDAEGINLLKIDALGLRTLSVIQDCLDQIGQTREWLMARPLTDEAAFEVVNNSRFAGIFQFEGYALQSLCQQMKIEEFEDIASLGALARPGPLNSGGANEFIKRRTGQTKVVYLHPMLEDVTKKTYGVVIYQETVMTIGRIMGRLSWEDVSSLRKAMSKSLGQEFFDQYWKKFLIGAQEQGVAEEDAKHVWENINTMGCLSGRTEIQNPFPNHVTPHSILLKDLAANGGYVRKHAEYAKGKGRGIYEHVGCTKWDIIKKQQIYCQQKDGRIRPRRLVDCWASGKKETWEVKAASGESLRATKKHWFKRGNGSWVELGRLKVGDEVVLMGKPPVKGSEAKPFKGTSSIKEFKDNRDLLRKKYKKCSLCGIKPYQETHHKDGDRSHNQIENLQALCRGCHKKIHRVTGALPIPHVAGKLARIEKIIFIGNPRVEETYDIQMPDPDNNFVANGFIVHNSWSFNKAHAVAYGMVTYWCMYLKAHYPLEYAAACLRRTSEDSCIKLLRELDSEGYKYIPFDIKHPEVNWSVKDGLLVGGLLNIDKIGPVTAAKLHKQIKAGKPLTPAMQKRLTDASTPYSPEKVFACRHKFSDVIANPLAYNIESRIWRLNDITSEMEGEFCFFAKITKYDLRDLNEPLFIQKRNGEYVTGQTLFLNLHAEDDTAAILLSIRPEPRRGVGGYLSIGKPIVEWPGGSIGQWYLWKGWMRKGFRKIYVARCWHESRVLKK